MFTHHFTSIKVRVWYSMISKHKWHAQSACMWRHNTMISSEVIWEGTRKLYTNFAHEGLTSFRLESLCFLTENECSPPWLIVRLSVWVRGLLWDLVMSSLFCVRESCVAHLNSIRGSGCKYIAAETTTGNSPRLISSFRQEINTNVLRLLAALFLFYYSSV